VWENVGRHSLSMHSCRLSDLLLVHAMCSTHSEHHGEIAVMLNAEFTVAVWHDPYISQPPKLKRQHSAKNCRLICKYIQYIAISFNT